MAGDTKGLSKRQMTALRTRDDIIDVASQEFSEKGLAGARIDEIAEKTQTSKRMIYYHFDLMAWVEGGAAPHMIIAHRAAHIAEGLSGNHKPALPARSRPVFAYPATPRYRGVGPVDVAASFEEVRFDKAGAASKAVPRDWLGAQ